MKKISLYTAVIALLSFSSCEEEENVILGCMDQTATNYNSSATEEDASCVYISDLIIGTWNSQTVVYSMDISEEQLQAIIQSAQMMSTEEFEMEFEIPMPTTDEEWMSFAVNQSSTTEDISGETISFTESTMTLSAEGEFISVEYTFSGDNILMINNPTEDFPFTQFEIITCTETELVLSTSQTEDEESYTITITCTK